MKVDQVVGTKPHDTLYADTLRYRRPFTIGAVSLRQEEVSVTFFEDIKSNGSVCSIGKLGCLKHWSVLGRGVMSTFSWGIKWVGKRNQEEFRKKWYSKGNFKVKAGLCRSILVKYYCNYY